ncbi:hypothetical protein H2203_008605 [Taxawa tesnikishii (nom. ined.)]|nr:hypothetical protein H2203_008605 [Dothideales sp. JES 119]
MAAAAVTNGYRPSDGDAELSAFYREMLQLRADVLAGKHPRIKLPESVVAQLRSPSPARISQPPNANAQPFLSNGHANGLGAAARGSANDDGLEYEPAPRSAATSAFNAPPPNESAAPSRPAARHISSSGFDPILLQKAPIVIQEELRQKRQRIERSLKDAYDQRRQSSARSKDTDAESASLLALSEILQKALRLVKPISGLKSAANKRKASSSSFDTNSYYSSQVNDWSSEQSSNGRESEAAAVDATGPSAQTASIKARQSQTDTASNVPLTKNPASELEGLQRQAYTTLQPDGRSVHDKGPHFYTNEPDEVYEAEKEESDYSPPAADAFVTDADGEAMDTDDGMFPSPTSSGTVFEFPPDDEEYEPQSFVTVPDEPPSPDVPVIRNHLTQIAAPQPARVSPLTVAKVPRLNQSQASSHQSNKGASHVQVPQFGAAGAIAEASSASASPRNSGRQSPMSGRTRAKRPARKPRQSRKRKREVEAAAVISGPSKKARDVRARPQSPEMYIKDEPVSPLHFLLFLHHKRLRAGLLIIQTPK